MDLRITDDIDVIIEVANYGKYILLQEQLRRLGFAEDSNSSVICKWKIDGIVVDIMPTDPNILGFSNPWYIEGLQNRISIDIDDIQVYILSLPYFLATKITALKQRNGGVDWIWSSDFEDIVKIINEVELDFILRESNEKLRDFLIISFTEFLTSKSYFIEACSAHMVKPFYSDHDIERVIDKITKILS